MLPQTGKKKMNHFQTETITIPPCGFENGSVCIDGILRRIEIFDGVLRHDIAYSKMYNKWENRGKI